MAIPWISFIFLLSQLHLLHAQQEYLNNKQLDCNNQYNSTAGNLCNGAQRSCLSYLTFRSDDTYNSPLTISYLLGADALQISTINEIPSNVAPLPANTLLVVPVNCSCSGEYYQHNATYNLTAVLETYFTIANDTYQGLTTCQAMVAQNPYGIRNLTVGLDLHVPLRCACPTSNQTGKGFKYLLNYIPLSGDSVSVISDLFGVDEQSLLDANELSSSDVIFPYTQFLVPLTTEASKIVLPAPPPAQVLPTSPVGDSNSSNKWVFIGIGIGAAVLVVLALSGFLFWCRRQSKSQKGKAELDQNLKKLSESADYTAIGETNNSWSLLSEGVRYAIDSLIVYKFEDLEMATGCFAEANRIKGSVYRGSFKGDDAAVKMMKGDVSGEINILKQINHSNILRLSGFCVHKGNSYLVYEYAENGSVSDWLHSSKYQTRVTLSWKQRVQIACDVADGLNYLHNYSNPPYIHKNLKTSNIVLDGNYRAKIANFGLARSVDYGDEGGLQLTRHVVGTQGYMAPEYIENGVITPRLDVFAFGVVMLELLSGREAASGEKNGGEELLSATISNVLEGDNVREKLRGLIDPALRHEYPLDLVFSMAQLAQNCVARDLNARPAVSEVFTTLSKILSSSLDWDPSDELGNTRSLSHGR